MPRDIKTDVKAGGVSPGYMSGFGNHFETEALEGALPRGMNSPQKCAFGLYGEQLSGTAFTAPGAENQRTWCYRIRPSQEGQLRFHTELGILDVAPKEIALIPRGLVYRVELIDGPARGYACENYGQLFRLPEKGPIGANCMANPRDFLAPVASYEDRETPGTLIVKWCGQFHQCDIPHSPLDVVAWHGNYAPVKYDLTTYCPVGAILFDHPDPSIFTVLTAPSGQAGTANIDFVLFRERWMVAENTFRPPWYHKNVMSELMGNIYGEYDAKPDGFAPGGLSLHNMMLPHGPDANAFEKASNANLQPEKLDETMSFMIETRFPQHLTAFAANEAPMQVNYVDCWADIKKNFKPKP